MLIITESDSGWADTRNARPASRRSNCTPPERGSGETPMSASVLRRAGGVYGFSGQRLDIRLTIGAYVRHGSLRRLGHGGWLVGMVTPGMTGSTRLDGIVRENAIDTCAVLAGTVWLNDQIGCVPLGAAMMIRIRVPFR